MHAPPELFMPKRNEKVDQNKKERGGYARGSSTKSCYWAQEGGSGGGLWCHIGDGGRWGFQVGCKEMQSAMSGSAVYYRQQERWFSWNPHSLEGHQLKLRLFRGLKNIKMRKIMQNRQRNKKNMIKSRERKTWTEGNVQVLFLAACFTAESKHYIMGTPVLQKPHLRDTISSGLSQRI